MIDKIVNVISFLSEYVIALIMAVPLVVIIRVLILWLLGY